MGTLEACLIAPHPLGAKKRHRECVVDGGGQFLTGTSSHRSFRFLLEPVLRIWVYYPLWDILKRLDSEDCNNEDEMDNSTDPRPPLSEWILDAYDVLCTHSLTADDHGGVQSIPREQAVDILCNADELGLNSEDANYALTRLLERGYFYEVDGEFRVTTPED